MSNRYRGPSIDAYNQVSVHLTKRFQRRRFKCEKLTDTPKAIPHSLVIPDLLNNKKKNNKMTDEQHVLGSLSL
jgi:hypothetical protein